jgi:hypothetical protein
LIKRLKNEACKIPKINSKKGKIHETIHINRTNLGLL